MCYSAESSIKNYAIGIAPLIPLFIYGNKFDKHFVFVIFFVIQIQLLEYFMWIDQKCGIINKIATITANFQLMLQPFFVLLGGYIFQTFNILDDNLILIMSSYLLVGSIMMFYRYSKMDFRKSICSKPDENGNLIWYFVKKRLFKNPIISHSLSTIPYLIFLIVPWYYLKDMKIGIFLILLFLISFVSHTLYYGKDKWQSTWCFFVTTMIYSYIIFRVLDEYTDIFNI